MDSAIYQKRKDEDDAIFYIEIDSNTFLIDAHNFSLFVQHAYYEMEKEKRWQEKGIAYVKENFASKWAK